MQFADVACALKTQTAINPVGTIKIVYFIWRKKSTRVVKIRGNLLFCTKQNTLKSLDSKVFQTGAAIQIRTGDLILTKDAPAPQVRTLPAARFLFAKKPLRRKNFPLRWRKRSSLTSYNLSVCFAASSPCRGASGEEDKPHGMPKPPLGRGGGIAQR